MATLASYVLTTRSKYSSFGGVVRNSSFLFHLPHIEERAQMFWDASQAYGDLCNCINLPKTVLTASVANNRIDAAIKAVLRTGAVPSTTKMTTSTSKASTSIKPASSSLGLPTGNVQLASPSTTKTSSSPTMSSSSMRTSSTKVNPCCRPVGMCTYLSLVAFLDELIHKYKQHQVSFRVQYHL